MRIRRRETKPSSPIVARAMLAVLVGFGLFSCYELRATDAIYRGINQQLAAEKIPVKTVEIGGKKIPVASYGMLADGSMWTFVNKTNELSAETTPKLISIPVEHGDAKQPMQIAKTIEKPLSELFTAAKTDGLPMMVASAFRSHEDQQKMWDGFMTTRGQAFTVSRVAKPGTSEHQTGLAIDISTASQTCAADSDKCELNSASIAWLAENAPRFGFIQRYPMGKQSITGFSNEEWHYRYVGVPLAKALSESGMTFDEFVAQVAPGLAKD